MRRTLLALVLLALPVFAQQPETVTIDSKVLGEKRNVLVRVPPTYRNGARAYPVLYLTDGESQFAHTVATADFLVRNGRMPEVIVVGVPNTRRTRDLTPTRVAETPELAGLGENGGGDRFLDFFEKELIPLVESRYRTQPFRVFAGHSFGGLFALHALFTRPNLFNATIAVSPTLTWDNRHIARLADRFFADKIARRATTLVVTVGNEGEVSSQAWDDFKLLVGRRAPKNWETQFTYFPDDDHGSVVLPSHFAGLKKVFAPWTFIADRQADPVRELARAKEQFANLSTRLGTSVTVPEPTLNFLGYLLLQKNRTDDAIDVFRQAVALYPRSANAHDSLGEAYEKAGNRLAAHENYDRAVQLGTESGDPNLEIYRRNASRVAPR
ncbi:MAG TPA: alpha/beta hydrolase-fold protein [Thermoanaerobaculia bacterium]